MSTSAFYRSDQLTHAYATVMSSGATVVRPGSYKLRPGQALWVSTAGNGTAEYAGPFNISIDSPGTVMTFTDNTPRTLRIRNNAGVERTVHINHQDSATPPYGQGGLAGSVPLMVALTDWSLGYPRESYQELVLPLTTNIAANTTLELKL